MTPVNARDVKNGPGRKSDLSDALHSIGYRASPICKLLPSWPPTGAAAVLLPLPKPSGFCEASASFGEGSERFGIWCRMDRP